MLVHVSEILEHFQGNENFSEWLHEQIGRVWTQEHVARIEDHLRKVDATALEWIKRVKEGALQ